MGEVGGVDPDPGARWGGELRPLHPLPIATVAARLQPPPFPPPPLLSTIKSRPCQSSRRGHESLSAACSSPELSPPSPTPPPACWRQRHFARDWLLPSPRRARGVWGRAVSGDRSTPAAGPRAQPRPGEISHTPFTPPPVGGAQAGSLPGSLASVGAPEPLCGPSRAPLIAEALWDVPREGWTPPG